MSYRNLQNYIVYARLSQKADSRWDDLAYIGSALVHSPEAALDEVARRENLKPGKFVVVGANFDSITTGTVTHRVVMD